jgi:hypothetical protein
LIVGEQAEPLLDRGNDSCGKSIADLAVLPLENRCVYALALGQLVLSIGIEHPALRAAQPNSARGSSTPARLQDQANGRQFDLGETQ